MLSSSILFPSDCSARTLADFEKLVVEGGAVEPEGLTRRIRSASRLLFLREPDGQLVGVGALKHPRSGYRDRVFAKARATATTRAGDRAMRFASAHGFESNGKPYPSGRGYNLVLYLHDAAPQSTNEHQPTMNYHLSSWLSEKQEKAKNRVGDFGMT